MSGISVIYPPCKTYGKRVFLGGSIEENTAENWQEKVINSFKLNIFANCSLLNPRRKDWNNEWTQDKNCPEFMEQVYWELNNIEISDYVFMYFDPQTKSPISLLELGLCAGSGKSIVVCCPDGYYRKGNVDIVCQKYNIPLFENLDATLRYCNLNWTL